MNHREKELRDLTSKNIPPNVTEEEWQRGGAPAPDPEEDDLDPDDSKAELELELEAARSRVAMQNEENDRLRAELAELKRDHADESK